MMDYISSFERVEKKYSMDSQQLRMFLPRMREHMEADEYGETAVCNLYLDTVDDLLARRSIEKPKYKEKMRLRSYGVPGGGDEVFLEIKKKSGGVVYKRRISMKADEAMAYLTQGAPLGRTGQIAREIEYMRDRYGLYPKVYLAYDRVAYREISESRQAVRITIDHNIRSREIDVDIRLGDAGRLLLPEDECLMEIKTTGAYPLWLASALSECRVFSTSFSKYGRAYQARAASLSPLSGQRPVPSRPSILFGGFSNAYSPV